MRDQAGFGPSIGPVPGSGTADGGGVGAVEAGLSAPPSGASSGEIDERRSAAQIRDFVASLPLASEVTSPARRASGAARSAATAASSAARAENSRTVGVARSARSSTASRSDSRIAVAVVLAELARAAVAGGAGVAARVTGVVRGSALVGPGEGLVGRGLVRGRWIERLGHRRSAPRCCWPSSSHEPANRASAEGPDQSSDSGSTSTDHGASTPSSRSAAGSAPRSTMFQRQRSARRAM